MVTKVASVIKCMVLLRETLNLCLLSLSIYWVLVRIYLLCNKTQIYTYFVGFTNVKGIRNIMFILELVWGILVSKAVVKLLVDKSFTCFNEKNLSKLVVYIQIKKGMFHLFD